MKKILQLSRLMAMALIKKEFTTRLQLKSRSIIKFK